MNDRSLNIVFTTSEPEAANRMLKSINEKMPNYSLSVSALFIGQETKVDLTNFCLPVSCIGTHKDYLSIADSRNICQVHLQQVMRASGGLGLVLDDDLRWVMPEAEFELLCEQLADKDCDMAFCGLTGDAPVPKEYTRASPLLDVLLEISTNDTSFAALSIVDFTSKVNVTDALDISLRSNFHHDYYTYDKKNFNKSLINIGLLEWNDFLNKLYFGKKTTRPISTPSTIIPATGRERGGATLVFNSSVLDYQNQNIQCGQFTSRRSDMIMATNAKNSGYLLFNTPTVLSHNRRDSFDSHDSRKLIGDILGYALVESSTIGAYSLSLFSKNLSQRLLNTVSILKETSHMLSILRDWLRVQISVTLEIEAVIENMIQENSKTLQDIKLLNIEEAVLAFECIFHHTLFSKRTG
jgi:hypothetical protein